MNTPQKEIWLDDKKLGASGFVGGFFIEQERG